ncbi:MAG: hypothetical protein IKS05_08700, partial [Oscillospiraceae bacterium]|nr:hypothetical protein [Oscillospiraceae bacterium]
LAVVHVGDDGDVSDFLLWDHKFSSFRTPAPPGMPLISHNFENIAYPTKKCNRFWAIFQGKMEEKPGPTALPHPNKPCIFQAFLL